MSDNREDLIEIINKFTPEDYAEFINKAPRIFANEPMRPEKTSFFNAMISFTEREKDKGDSTIIEIIKGLGEEK
jgi:hypothetical protein